jgi:hypothetical protein
MRCPFNQLPAGKFSNGVGEPSPKQPTISSLKSMKPDWIMYKRINILFQVGLHPDPELTAMGVPEIWKFIKYRG